MFYVYNDVTRVEVREAGRGHILVITRKRNDYETTVFVQMRNDRPVLASWAKMDAYIQDKIENGEPGGYCSVCAMARCDEWVKCECCQELGAAFGKQH